MAAKNALDIFCACCARFEGVWYNAPWSLSTMGSAAPTTAPRSWAHRASPRKYATQYMESQASNNRFDSKFIYRTPELWKNSMQASEGSRLRALSSKRTGIPIHRIPNIVIAEYTSTSTDSARLADSLTSPMGELLILMTPYITAPTNQQLVYYTEWKTDYNPHSFDIHLIPTIIGQPLIVAEQALRACSGTVTPPGPQQNRHIRLLMKLWSSYIIINLNIMRMQSGQMSS